MRAHYLAVGPAHMTGSNEWCFHSLAASFHESSLAHSCSPMQEFDSCERAREFLESSRPRDFEAVGSAVELAFARPAEPARSEPARSEPERDWSCPACPATNFARRRACFQCGEPRPPAPEDALPRPDREPHAASGRQPRSHTVLLTNLDASIAEEKLVALCAPFGQGTRLGLGLALHMTVSSLDRACTLIGPTNQPCWPRSRRCSQRCAPDAAAGPATDGALPRNSRVRLRVRDICRVLGGSAGRCRAGRARR